MRILGADPICESSDDTGEGQPCATMACSFIAFSRLGAAATVLAAKIPRRDEVFTEWAIECGKAVHQFDGVMSHTFNCRRSTLA
jgi:hypothetical protein